MKLKLHAFLIILGTLICAAVSHADEQAQDFMWSDVAFMNQQYTDDLPQLKKDRVIRALVVHSKTDFFVHKGKINGLDAEYLKHYEKFLNKDIKKEAEKVHIVYVPVSFDQLIPFLQAGKGDIAAAMMTITPEREKQVNFVTGGKMSINELVVTHKQMDNLQSLDDLADKTIYVVKGSSYVEHLQLLSRRLQAKGLQPINIKLAAEYLSSEDILEMVNAGMIKITVVDDYRANLWAKILPDIKVRDDLAINMGGIIGWAVRKSNPELQKSLNEVAKTVNTGTLLGNMLFNRFYKQTRWIKNPGIKSEMEKYGRYVDLFKKYGDKYNFDYYALIALAYQESGLNQKLKSHRGAIGIMQILPSTAADKNVNISDIQILENNIHAGTKYLDFLRRQYFSDPEISSLNKVLFSWAAYNAGPGNVRKMRRLAEKMGLNKNIWFRNVEIAAGRIIGTETVRYVSNIYKYYHAYLLVEAIDKQRKINMPVIELAK